MFSLQLAWKPMVVINGLKAMQEVLVTCGEDAADHPSVPIFEYLHVKLRSQDQSGESRGDSLCPSSTTSTWARNLCRSG
ncbi:Cytochrome P450 [Apodemus speciosus]|uniref:Cytochrome P450 n=1 Tax=Apodemus speciosus TaxID=105296 RepID=A0ABQ0FK88_APOSI